MEAKELLQVTINEDDLLLFDVELDKRLVASSLDAYLVNERLLVAVEPLFDSLNLRYKREKTRLTIWKDDQPTVYFLDPEIGNVGDGSLWADDNFYLFVDIDTLHELFSITSEYGLSNLKLAITTQDYKFPVQQLAQLAQQRKLSQSAQRSASKKYEHENLLPDQYRMFTVPHGNVSINAAIDQDSETSLNYSIQTASDLLYHSANLTVSDSNRTDYSGRLFFSRHKLLPDDLILGLFDQYSFGDVNGYSNNLTTSTNSGLGFNVSHETEDYRNRNIGTTITEVAPPGWEAELYRNGQFIEVKRVPTDGNLIFEDVETQYGSNRYEIKLFGPFGEVDIREQYLDLDRNALGEGQSAYNIFAFDNRQNLINNDSDESYSINDIGVSYDYGVTDEWLVGFSANHFEDIQGEELDYITLKNALAFPGLLFENEVSFQKDYGYSQVTSVRGNAFGRDTYTLRYESADDYESGRFSAKGITTHNFSVDYSGNFRPWSYSIGGGYNKFDGDSNWQFRNRLSRSIFGMSFSNTLSYNYSEFESESESVSSDKWLGNTVLAGSLTNNVRLSSSITYLPDGDDFIDATTATLSWNTESGLYHNLRGTYRPNNTDDNQWFANYNLSWNHDSFRMTLTSAYSENEDWSIGLGVRFFLGYDYYNNRMLIAEGIGSTSATLNVKTYLDRNPNGWRDEGDWDLEGVKFIGNSAWKGITSGEDGHTVLPGVSPNIPFRFSANWEYGTQSLENDYTIYTHSGAYVDVNMPFYVNTELTGFVFKQDEFQSQQGLSNVILELRDLNDQLVKIVFTDLDGYYSITGLLPGYYELKVGYDYLEKAGYSGEFTGYKFATPDTGGFIEADPIILIRTDINSPVVENIKILELNENNSEPNVWFEEDNINNGQIFSYPVNKEIVAQKNYYEPDELPNKPIVRNTLAVQPVVRAELPLAPPTGAVAIPSNEITEQGEVDTQVPEISGSLVDENGRELPGDLLLIRQLETTRASEAAADQANQQSLANEAAGITTNEQVSNLSESTTTSTSSAEPVVVTDVAAPLPSIGSNLSAVSNEGNFTIQLGAYSAMASAQNVVSSLGSLASDAVISTINRSGKQIYRVRLGRFLSQNEAVNFSRENIPQSIPSYVRTLKGDELLVAKNTRDVEQVTNGYVIQFIATQNKNTLASQAAQFGAIGEVFIAEKTVNGSVWYSLTSQVFATKEDAQSRLNQTGLSGWAVESKHYRNSNKVN